MTAAPLDAAVARLRAGGLVAYPTETVWGLAADACSDAALARLAAWKHRAPTDPISVLLDAPEALEAFDLDVAPFARELVEAFWPGPLTLVVVGREPFARGVAREDGAVGLRCSAHPVAAALARRLRLEGIGPITSTSLNRSGAPAARTRVEASALCGDGTDAPALLDVAGADAGGAGESTVVDCTVCPPRVLREGAIELLDLRRTVQEIRAA